MNPLLALLILPGLAPTLHPCPQLPPTQVGPMARYSFCQLSCCGEHPRYTDPLFAGFTGPIALMTASDFMLAANLDIVLRVFDVTGHACATPGSEYNPLGLRYNNPSWTRTNLGTVFGVTLDDVGNIYLSHTSSMDFDANGAIGGGAGAVYKIDAYTGAPTLFCSLPNATTPNTAPGLGNICFDCTKGQFFVSNFDDGRIYRVNRAGQTLSTFDHATGAVVAGGAPEAGETYGTFVPLGERVWAVKRYESKLYYSIWTCDRRNWLTTTGPSNEIWSIRLNSSGEFVTGSERLEVGIPAYGNSAAGDIAKSAPVADLSFTCTDAGVLMLAAERDMDSDTGVAAHLARVLEFETGYLTPYPPPPSPWSLTANNLGSLGLPFSVLAPGGPGTGTYGTDACGGCDYDMNVYPCPGHTQSTWATGDALFYLGSDTYVYGLVAFVRTLASAATNVYIDYNSLYPTTLDKYKQGDTAVSCPPPSQPGASICFGDGSTAPNCPCSPPNGTIPAGLPGHGCPNSSNPYGAILTATGLAYSNYPPYPGPDTVKFIASGLATPSTACILLKGTTTVTPGTFFGDGLRCCAGTLTRLRTKSATGGVVTFGGTGSGEKISVLGASPRGETACYVIWYRDPSSTFCIVSAVSNLTNSYTITWL